MSERVFCWITNIAKGNVNNNCVLVVIGTHNHENEDLRIK